MNKTTKIYVPVFLISALLTAGPLASTAVAADCRALETTIRKERNLIRKQVMISDAIKECPKDAGIAYQEGYLNERLRKYDEAIKSYQNAISIDPVFAKAYFSLGDVQMLRKNYKEAASYYQKGLGYEPGDARAEASLKEANSKLGVLTGKVSTPAPEVASRKKEEKKVAAKPKVTATNKAAATDIDAPIMRLQVPFQKKTTYLSQDAKDVLGVVVGQAMNRKDMAGVKFEVGGHTDNLGDASKNYEISKQRANQVQKYLKDEFGIATDRLKVAYHGQKKPEMPNNSPANRKHNRRVDFTKIRQ